MRCIKQLCLTAHVISNLAENVAGWETQAVVLREILVCLTVEWELKFRLRLPILDHSNWTASIPVLDVYGASDAWCHENGFEEGGSGIEGVPEADGIP